MSETTLTLSEIRTAIEEFRPPDRPPEHQGAYFYEEGQRDMCDELLEFFTDDDN